MGTFVTLNIDGKLRGGIGWFTSTDLLYEVVNQMASGLVKANKIHLIPIIYPYYTHKLPIFYPYFTHKLPLFY